MKVDINATTDGKGHYTEETRLVSIKSIELGYQSTDMYPENPFFGELRAYFDPSGLVVGSWNIDGYGLIYNDKRWLREFKKGLLAAGFSVRASRDVSYSAQVLQGTDYVSMDIGAAFYTSWKRLSKPA